MRHPGWTTKRRVELILAATAVAAISGSTGASAAAPAPDPGGRERAIVKVPPPGGKRYLGVHDPKILGRGRDGARPAKVARYAKGVGAEIFRFTIDWPVVEPTKGRWDEGAWRPYEDAYRKLTRRGIKPMIGISNAPVWARDVELIPLLCPTLKGCEFPPRPAMYGEWAEFAGEVARRFPKAAAIEIWNEPNHWSFWKPEPDPERYAAMVAAAYDAIKAESPQIKVLAGALAGGDGNEPDPLRVNVVMGMQEFLTRAYEAEPSIAGHMDGLSFHQASQSLRYGKNSALARSFRNARRIRRLHDPRKTPLWVTEFGLSTTDGEFVTPEVHADALQRAYRRVMTMRDVRAFVIHTLSDRKELPESDGEHGVGMTESLDPFVPKPAYCAFAGRVRRKAPMGDCQRIRESRVSRCTRSLARLQNRIADADGDRRAQLRQRHRRKAARCVPCTRKHTALLRSVRRASPARAADIRAILAALDRRCSPCERRLIKLQRRFTRAIPTLRLDVLNRHERTRRRCR